MSESFIPANSDTTRFTITAPKTITKKLVSPEISGMGIINGTPVTRPAIPVDNTMQAFLYRHLVPAQELVLAHVEQPSPLIFEAKLPKSGVIEIALGGEVRVTLNGHVRKGMNGAKLKLDHPPEGLTADKGWVGRKKSKGKIDAKGFAAGSILLKAEEPLKPGFKTSLVVAGEIKRGKETTLYYAPAIPIKIVKSRDN